jgi:hypothetical protein
VRRAAAALFGVRLLIAALPAAAQDAGSPHRMTKADGSLDMAACGVCHKEDMSLQRTKLETCTLCHAPTVHAGSAEHLRASPAEVQHELDERPKGSPALPSDEQGRIYCGTCHFFHDPKVLSEDWPVQGWLPPDSGLPGAVRQGVLDRWARLTPTDAAVGATFATKGTRQLRLPVDAGQLCAQCHGAQR